jgi:hypothetical protein
LQTFFFSRSIRKRPLLLALSLLVSSAAGASAAGSQSWWTLSFGNSGSAELLEKLVEKASIDTSAADPVSVIGPDGTMPEIAKQYIPMKSSPGTAIEALKAACAELGLDPPTQDQLGSEPDRICAGKYGTARVSVVSRVSGGGDSHFLSLEIYAIDY